MYAKLAIVEVLFRERLSKNLTDYPLDKGKRRKRPRAESPLLMSLDAGAKAPLFYRALSRKIKNNRIRQLPGLNT